MIAAGDRSIPAGYDLLRDPTAVLLAVSFSGKFTGTDKAGRDDICFKRGILITMKIQSQKSRNRSSPGCGQIDQYGKRYTFSTEHGTAYPHLFSHRLAMQGIFAAIQKLKTHLIGPGKYFAVLILLQQFHYL